MFTLPIFTLPANCAASRSMIGDSMRQGPHHGAQKSTTTGLSDLRTSASQLAEVNSSKLSLAICLTLSVVVAPSLRASEALILGPIIKTAKAASNATEGRKPFLSAFKTTRLDETGKRKDSRNHGPAQQQAELD